MARRHLISADGSIVTVESSRSFRLRGQGRTLPHSKQRALTPGEILRSQSFGEMPQRRFMVRKRNWRSDALLKHWERDLTPVMSDRALVANLFIGLLVGLGILVMLWLA